MNTHSLDLELSSSQYASKTDTASLSITGNITIECWVKLESAPSDSLMVLVSKFNSSTDNASYALDYLDSSGTKTIRFGVSTTGTGANYASASVAQTISTGTWTHVVAAWTASTSTAEFFINGSSIGSDTTGALTAIFDGNAALMIGARIPAGGSADNFLDGKIDEVRIWNDVRSDAEIAANIYKSCYFFTSGTDNFVDGWGLNNSYASVSGNHDLTASGSPVFSTDIPFDDNPHGAPFISL